MVEALARIGDRERASALMDDAIERLHTTGRADFEGLTFLNTCPANPLDDVRGYDVLRHEVQKEVERRRSLYAE